MILLIFIYKIIKMDFSLQVCTWYQSKIAILTLFTSILKLEMFWDSPGRSRTHHPPLFSSGTTILGEYGNNFKRVWIIWISLWLILSHTNQQRTHKDVVCQHSRQLITSFIVLSGFLPKPAHANPLEFVLPNHAFIGNRRLLVSWLNRPQQKTTCQGNKTHEPTLSFAWYNLQKWWRNSEICVVWSLMNKQMIEKKFYWEKLIYL